MSDQKRLQEENKNKREVNERAPGIRFCQSLSLEEAGVRVYVAVPKQSKKGHPCSFRNP